MGKKSANALLETYKDAYLEWRRIDSTAVAKAREFANKLSSTMGMPVSIESMHQAFDGARIVDGQIAIDRNGCVRFLVSFESNFSFDTANPFQPRKEGPLKVTAEIIMKKNEDGAWAAGTSTSKLYPFSTGFDISELVEAIYKTFEKKVRELAWSP